MKRRNYGLFLFLFCAMTLSALAQAVTNASAGTSPPLPKTVSDYWDLVIGAISPIIIWGLAKVMPKIPMPLLPVLAPVVGIGLGLLVNWLAGQNLGWFEMAKAGALAVFVRETVNQWVTKRYQAIPPVPSVPSTGTN